MHFNARVCFAALCVLIATMTPNGSAAASAKGSKLGSSAGTTVSNMLLQSLSYVKALAREVSLQQTQTDACNATAMEYQDAAQDMLGACASTIEYVDDNIDFDNIGGLLVMHQILDPMEETIEGICRRFRSVCGVGVQNTVNAAMSVVEECDNGSLTGTLSASLQFISTVTSEFQALCLQDANGNSLGEGNDESPAARSGPSQLAAIVVGTCSVVVLLLTVAFD